MAEVDGGQALGEEALLAHRVAVVGGDAAVTALAGDGSRGLQQGAGGAHLSPSLAEQLAQYPWIAMCVGSARKPVSCLKAATSGSARCTSTSRTALQLRHTRCM